MDNHDNLNDKLILYADNIRVGEFKRTSIEKSQDIVCSEIMKGFKNLGITTEESATAISTHIKSFIKLMTPEFIDQEIWYVKNNPNLNWWQKRKLIKKLKIQLDELNKEDKVND